MMPASSFGHPGFADTRWGVDMRTGLRLREIASSIAIILLGS